MMLATQTTGKQKKMGWADQVDQEELEGTIPKITVTPDDVPVEKVIESVVEGLEKLDASDDESKDLPVNIGLITADSSEADVSEFLPKMFPGKGDGKFRNNFCLKLGVEKMPPSIYSETGETKPNSEEEVWMAFSMGVTGKFWEWSLWKSKEAAQWRIDLVKENQGTKKLIYESCTCGDRIRFHIHYKEKKTKKNTFGVSVEIVECECEKSKSAKKSSLKPKKETPEPKKKSPTKPKVETPEPKKTVKGPLKR